MPVNSVFVEEMKDNGSTEAFKPSSTNDRLVSFGKKLEKNVGDKECFSPFTFVTTLNETSEPAMNDLRSLIVSDYLAKHCYSGNAICEMGRIDRAEIAEGKIPSEKIVEQKPNLSQEFNTDFPEMDSSSHNDSFDENQDLRQNFDQATEEDEKLTSMASSMQAKELRQIEQNVWSNKELLENTLPFNDETSASDLNPKNISITGNDGAVINQQNAETRTEEVITSAQSIHDDKSLPGAAALSGPITTSGHIPNSGNISHRSDSSTTSTHSFAFPILQSEWNSSPVRMAKADRKQLRKHRWRTALLCCKF